jgi:hypothetical protein
LYYLKKKDYNYAIIDSPPLSVIQQFVVSNSNLQDIDMVSWVGEIKTTPALALSLEEDPSKNTFHIEVLGGGSLQNLMGFFLTSIGGRGTSES